MHRSKIFYSCLALGLALLGRALEAVGATAAPGLLLRLGHAVNVVVKEPEREEGATLFLGRQDV